MAEAVSVVKDGDVVMIGGFGSSGIPLELIEALRRHAPKDLTIISNNAGVAEEGIASLLRDSLVRKMVCSFPRSKGSVWLQKRYKEGSIDFELVPQGTLGERIRAAGAGLAAFYTPTPTAPCLRKARKPASSMVRGMYSRPPCTPTLR